MPAWQSKKTDTSNYAWQSSGRLPCSFLRERPVDYQTQDGKKQRQNSDGSKDVRHGEVINQDVAGEKDTRDATHRAGGIDQPANPADMFQLPGRQADHI